MLLFFSFFWTKIPAVSKEFLINTERSRCNKKITLFGVSSKKNNVAINTSRIIINNLFKKVSSNNKASSN